VTWALSSLDFCQVTANTLMLLPWLGDAVIDGADHRGKYRIPTRAIQRDDSWRKPHRVTHLVQLDRRPCREPRISMIDKHDAAAGMVSEGMTVFRSPIFLGQEIFRAHSAFSFDVITGLMREAAAYRLEFADSHLDMIPRILAGLA
jgi:hypothetical protein